MKYKGGPYNSKTFYNEDDKAKELVDDIRGQHYEAELTKEGTRYGQSVVTVEWWGPKELGYKDVWGKKPMNIKEEVGQEITGNEEFEVKDYELVYTGGGITVAYGVYTNGLGFSLGSWDIIIYDDDARKQFEVDDYAAWEEEHNVLKNDYFTGFSDTSNIFKSTLKQVFDDEVAKNSNVEPWKVMDYSDVFRENNDILNVSVGESVRKNMGRKLAEELVEPFPEDIEFFEKYITDTLGYEIEAKGKTWFMHRDHYQIRSPFNNNTMDDLRDFARELDKLDELMDKREIPMTYSAGLTDDGYITAGLDLNKKWIPDNEDSVKPQPTKIKVRDFDLLDEALTTEKEAISQAIKVAKRDGYDQVVYKDSDGLYWIHRDYPSYKLDSDDTVVKRVSVYNDKGVVKTKVVDSLYEGSTRRYSDVVPYEKRRYWYWTKHGLGPGTLPKGVNVLDAKDGQNQKGTWGVFVLLDAVLNTDELEQYDLIELAPQEDRQPVRANIWGPDGETKGYVRESRQLNEGPGAGYKISGKIGDVTINDISITVDGETDNAIYYGIEGNITATLEDVSSSSYYYGGTISETPIKINYIGLSAEKSWELPEPNEEDVYYLLTHLDFETVYGGGWSHSSFDNDLSLDYNDCNYSSEYDLDKLEFVFTDPKAVDAIDKYASGEAYDTEYSVLDEDEDEIEYFDTEESAIRYAKENSYPYVAETHWGWEYAGNGDYNTTDRFDSSEIIWTNEDVEV